MNVRKLAFVLFQKISEAVKAYCIVTDNLALFYYQTVVMQTANLKLILQTPYFRK